MLETINYLERLLKPGDSVVIGLSGGKDSMCLLDLLMKLNKKITIIAAHINHNIREESNEEAKIIEKYCKEKNVIFETIKFPKKSNNKDFNESELREKRYDYFEKIINKYQAKYLFTAHHGDDLIETILMRITRGSDIKGYSGFDLVTPKCGYQIIKPLIYTTKEEIDQYNEKNNIPYVEDQTNSSSKYTRNRYRHKVLPFLKQENPQVHLKYLKFNQELQKYYNYVLKKTSKEFIKRYENNSLNLDNIDKIDDLILENIIKKLLDINYPDNLYLVNDKHISMIINIIHNKEPNLSLNLPNGLVIYKRYNELYIRKGIKEKKEYDIEIKKHTVLPNNHYIDIIEKSDEKSNYYIRLNSKEIKLPLHARTRKPGDKMVIKNSIGSKKIKDIYIDSKIEPEKRDSEPIVVDSNNTIIWLPGIKKSQFDKANNEEYDIILRYY